MIVGGHTIDDKEPKYGLSVMGVAAPEDVVRNVGAQGGDVLVLTKAIGVGVMNTALKRGLETEDSIRDVIESMARLNRAASEAMVEVGVNAATDVTGFGILGHLREMALGSGLCRAAGPLPRCPCSTRRSSTPREGVRPGRTEDVIAAMEPARGVGAVPTMRGRASCAIRRQAAVSSWPWNRRKADDLLAALDTRGETGTRIGIDDVRRLGPDRRGLGGAHNGKEDSRHHRQHRPRGR